MFNLTVSIKKLVYQTLVELEEFSMPWNLVVIVGFNWVFPIYSAIKSKKIPKLELMLGVIC